MKQKIIELFQKYREIIMYLIFGGLTTVVNTVSYFAASFLLGMPAWLSSIVAWVFAVTFAFITNKLYVFQSKTETSAGTLRETIMFFATRLSSLGMQVAIMGIFVDRMNLHEVTFYIIAQIVVLVVNYVASKFWIFKKAD